MGHAVIPDSVVARLVLGVSSVRTSLISRRKRLANGAAVDGK